MIKIMKYGQVPNSEIFARVTPAVDVASIVADILYDVRKNGDRAVLQYCAKFDKAELDTLEVSKQEIREAIDTVEPEFLEILKEAAAKLSGRGLRGYPSDTAFSLDDPRVRELDGCAVAILEEGETYAV